MPAPWEEYQAGDTKTAPPPPWEEYVTPANKAPWEEYSESPASAAAPPSSTPASTSESQPSVVPEEDAKTVFAGMPVKTAPEPFQPVKKFTAEEVRHQREDPYFKIPYLPEHIEDMVSKIPNPSGIDNAVLSRAVIDTANFVQSPEGLALLGVGAAEGAAQKLIGRAFMAKAVTELPDRLHAVIDAKTPEEKKQAMTGLVEDGLMLTPIAHELPERGGVRPPSAPPEQVASVPLKPLPTAAAEIDPILHKLPGDTQQKAAAIIAKQAAGKPLSENEQATLIQLRSFASQDAERMATGPTSTPEPPTTPPAAPAPAGTTPIPVTGGGRSSLFEQERRKAAAAQAVAPLAESITAAENVDGAQATAATAKAALPIIADKASSPPKVEPPASGQAPEQKAAEERKPADAAPAATEAAVKPVGTRIVGPAIRDADGKIISQGVIGDNHAKLKTAEIRNGNADAADAEHVFIDDQGNVLNRNEAWDLAKKAGQIPADVLAAQERGQTPPELHSEHLTEKPNEPIPSSPLDALKPPTVEPAVVAPDRVDEATRTAEPPGVVSPEPEGDFDPDAVEKLTTATPQELPGIPKPEPKASTPLVGEDGQRITSTQHAFTDAERAARGESPREQQGREAWGETWDRAKEAMEKSSSKAADLVSELSNKPRATTALEEAIMLRHKVSVMNELDGHIKTSLDENADPAERIEARVNTARLMDELNEIDRATSFSGSETGRALNFRKALAAEDYSLVKMLQKKQLGMADKWDSLSPGEKESITKQVEAQSTRIAELEKQIAERDAKLAEQRETAKNDEADKAIASMAKPKTPADEYAQGILDRIQKGLKSEADKARARIRERSSKAFAVVDPVVVYDVAVIGAEKLFNTGLDFARWTKEMADDIGEHMRPYLTQETFEQSQKLNSDAVDKAAPKTVAERLKAKPKTDAEARTNLVKVIEGRKAAGKDVGQWIQKLAENFVRNGITEREALVTAVHDAVKDALPDAEPRDIRDAISGYGDFKELSKDEVKAKLRDLKGQMQQVSKIEDITATGRASKTGVQRRIPSAEERALQKEVNQVKKEYGIETDDPEALASAMGALKTRLRNRIEDLQRAIEKREKLPKGGKKLVDDEEAAELRRQKDDLQKEYEAVFKEPKKTPEEIALAAFKTRTQNRINALNERLKTGDYSKVQRKPVALDAEGQKLKSEVARVKLQFDREVYKDRMAHRETWEKAADYFPKYSRAFLLSNPVTLAKLTAAAAWRMAVTPMEELIGSGLSNIPGVSEVAARAPREGGMNAKAEAKAWTEAFTNGMRDAWQKLRNGETDMDVVSGKRRIAPHEWLDVFGNIHGALKVPVVRAEFARSMEKRMAFNIANGVDVTDPMVQTRIATESFKDAQKSIFQQDNRVVTAYNAALRVLEQPSKSTGKPSVGAKLSATAARTLFPIVKIPTNIVAEAIQYATGSVTGSARLAAALRKGASTLKPEEADLIMRELKKGSLGGAVMLLGFLAPQVIGGYYQAGKKREESDVKAGGARIYDTNIPSTVLHNPAVEMLQVGSTIRRVADSKLRNRDQDSQGIPTGVLAAGLGLIDEVPFVRDTTEMSKAFNPYERTQYFGELARSRLEPQLVQWLAQQTDRRNGEAVKRKPETFSEHMKVGLPGARETVPEKTEDRSTPSMKLMIGKQK